MSKLQLLIIVGSTRPKRVGGSIARWLTDQVAADGRFEPVVADLRAMQLPLMDEPNHPRLHTYTNKHTIAWSHTVAAADAVIWVTPEYNYSYVAPMKNALDYLSAEWAYLPTGFVSYGGVSGGLRAVEAFKIPVTCCRSVPSSASFPIPFAGQHVSDGVFEPVDVTAASVPPLLDDLAKLHEALHGLRAATIADLGY